jgi:hypothetical protein
MTRFLVRRAAALFVLSFLLTAPWVAAEPRLGHGAAPAPLLGQIWSQLTALWGDIGCIIDPSGRCLGFATTQGDIGCGIDPDGRCHESATSQSDIGCIIDPNGRCLGSATSQGDIGCGIDPSGHCGQ